MFKRTVTADDLARLRESREAADVQYNETLSAVDRARQQRVPEFPQPPPAYDEFQITPLNTQFDILSARPAFAPGWRGRVQEFIWRTVAPLFDQQQRFNGTLVDHINRNVVFARGMRTVTTTTLELVRDCLTDLYAFELHLVDYLQRITLLVDTRNRETQALMRRINEDNGEQIDILDHRTVALVEGISALGDDLQKRWESMVAREHRFQAAVERLTAAHDELRQALSTVQGSAATLRRQLERLSRDGVPTAPAPAPAAPPSASPRAAPASIDAGLHGSAYVAFEDEFRGSVEDIRARLASYVDRFAGAQDVVDVGCGRGEFLELLRDRGVSAEGVDTNAGMVAACHARGLRAVHADGLSYLQQRGDASVGGVFAAQVVEHLEPEYLMRLLDESYRTLRPGALLVLETINPACWFAFFESYIRDITHVRPIHPDTLRFLLVAHGFQHVAVEYRAPYPEHEKLQPLGVAATDDEPLGEMTATLNANVEKINRLLFTHLDYAVVGRRP